MVKRMIHSIKQQRARDIAAAAFRETSLITLKKQYIPDFNDSVYAYTKHINNKMLTDRLTQLMHGYKNEKVDIAKAYELLGTDGRIPDTSGTSVPDILSKTVDALTLLIMDIIRC